jgi:hypothetical protein
VVVAEMLAEIERNGKNAVRSAAKLDPLVRRYRHDAGY